MMENNFQYLSAAVTDKGLSEKRPQNEDSYLEVNQNGLFAVADGVGGAQAGDVASQMAMEILGEAFFNLQQNGDAEDIMKIGIEKANAAIFQMSNELAQLSTMATTVAALHLSGNIATIGHVGDSRVYRLDASGELFRETQDHSVVEDEIRAGRLTPEQAVNHPSRNVISRALGAEPFVEIDMKTIMFEPGTAFLLCSDGVTRHLEDAEIRELLISNPSSNEICQQIKNICYERGAEDNLTAVVVKVSSEVASQIPFTEPLASSDFEEATIASVRPPAAGNGFDAYSDVAREEEPTRDLHLPVATDSAVAVDKAQTSAVIDQAVSTAPLSYQSDNLSFSPPIEAPVKVAPPPVNIVPEHQTKSGVVADSPYRDHRFDYDRAAPQPATDSGFLSKALSSLIFLLIGSILGAVLYYLLAAPAAAPPSAPQISEMQTQNIPVSAFEENRRNVDRNPEQFILANSSSPQDAVDFYLLGRAFLLTGRYSEAKESLNESKNRLAQADEANSKTLVHEIALALAVINDPFAQKSFEKDVIMSNSGARPQLNNSSVTP